jgi:glutamate-1-semialdehyde aminotransferase
MERGIMNFKKSNEWLERAKKVIPFPYNQTFSKGPEHYVQGASPVFASRGRGPYVYDVDDNRYIDLVMGLMPLVLGYVDVAKDFSFAVYNFDSLHLGPLPMFEVPVYAPVYS